MRLTTVHGEVRVELTRPALRFGTGLHVIVSNGGSVTHHATGIDEIGELVFEPYDPATEAKPLMMLPDPVALSLRKALNGETLSGDDDSAVRRHLDDAITVRDRSLTAVEKLLEHAQLSWLVDSPKA